LQRKPRWQGHQRGPRLDLLTTGGVHDDPVVRMRNAGHHGVQLNPLADLIGQVIDQLMHATNHPAQLQAPADGEKSLQIDAGVARLQSITELDTRTHRTQHTAERGREVVLSGRGTHIRLDPARQWLCQPGLVGCRPRRVRDRSFRESAEPHHALPQIGGLER